MIILHVSPTHDTISYQIRNRKFNYPELCYSCISWLRPSPHTVHYSNLKQLWHPKTKKSFLSQMYWHNYSSLFTGIRNDDEFGFNSALNHKIVEDGPCCLRCLAPSGSCPISLHQTRQTESEKWRRPACANINPKFLASIPSWPWFGMTSICWLAAHISLQIVWARLICFYARLVKNVMPR